MLLDLSTADILNSPHPGRLWFAAVAGMTRFYPAGLLNDGRGCLDAPLNARHSSSRYLLTLLRHHPQFKSVYAGAMAYCQQKPTPIEQCDVDGRFPCLVDEDKKATRALCDADLASLWVERDAGNSLAWRALAAAQYDAGARDAAFRSLQQGLEAEYSRYYTSERIGAWLESSRQLYSAEVIEYLWQTEAPVALSDPWGLMDIHTSQVFTDACLTESEDSDQWLELCLALAEKIEVESDALVEASVAGGLTRVLLEQVDRPSAESDARARKAERDRLQVCWGEYQDQSKLSGLESIFEDFVTYGETGAMRNACKQLQLREAGATQ